MERDECVRLLWWDCAGPGLRHEGLRAGYHVSTRAPRAFGVPEGALKEKELLEALGTVLTRAAAAAARAAGKAAKLFVESYERPREFEADWKWLRLAVPLQVRLITEQVLWDKRGGWRDLVTGFGPVKGRGAPGKHRERE